uniref:Structural maintenance of chromosomes protein n=1 Tax=Anopheles funestus TaxID=62324 RepID=A0A4Y0BM41_ANOFN
MYLKEIRISGFKSYTHETVVEQLHPKHNVVVGRNGSGKSNFFCAIEFVLSDEYNNLRQPGRVGLINKGTSKARLDAAFVELVFEKAPISSGNKSSEMNEVRIRRTISATKDQYKLNGRIATRKEVVAMLDSIGLSSCNPYYIVQQGKINQLATAHPVELLQVFFEIGGIRVYDEKLKEILKLKQDADTCLKQTRIEYTSLNENFKLLSKERKEQEKFEQLEKKQRGLNMLMLEKKHSDSVAALQHLEQNEKSWEEKQRLYVLQKLEAVENINVLKTNRKENKIALTNALSKHSRLNEDNLYLQKQKAQIELQIKDMEHKLASESNDQKSKQTQLEKLRDEIEQAQQGLKNISDDLKLAQERRDEFNSRLLKKVETRSELIDKQRRGIQFSNQKERDHFLKNEIDYIMKQITQQQESLKETTKEHNIAMEYLENEKQNGIQEQEALTLLMKKEHTYGEHLILIKRRLQESKNLLDEQLAEEIKIKENLQYCKVQNSEQTQKIKKLIGTGAYQGLQSVSKILDMLRSQGGQCHPVVKGYYGQLMENFNCEEAIYRAVETVAGSKLNYHIVESDTVANEIIALCNKNKLPGEFNFLPLNRLKATQQVYPKENAMQPLISLLQFEPKYELAFQHIFGKTLLCDGLEIAATANKQYKLSCVTREGDIVTSGTITGGYRAPSSSKIRQLMHMRDIGQTITDLERDLNSTWKHIKKLQTLMRNDEILQTLEETKLQKLLQRMENIQIKVRAFPERCRKLEEKCEEKERKIRTLTTELEILATKKDSLKRELSTKFICVVSQEDEQIIAQLDQEIRIIKQQQHEAFNAELHVQKQKHKLENKLNSKLIPTRDALTALLKNLDCTTLTQQMELYQQQQQTLTNKINSLVQDINTIDRQVCEIRNKDKKIAEELECWNQQLRQAEERIEIKDTNQVAFETRKCSLEEEIRQYAEQINALGVLPAIDPVFQKMPLPKLMKELEQTNKQISKFSSVNKAAVDEHTRVAQSLKGLDRKLKETEDARALHESSIQQLRAQRVDCIENIFTKVNANFSEIFSKFYPAGCARLILQTTENESKGDENEDVLDRYVGLGLQVSFMESEGFLNGVNALSGGQKTLVAITLILAMQRYNPAPFYLFDEMDQALDSSHRRVIADEIRKLSESSQFITITFRRELLEHAHKHFGVRYQNNISHIGPVSKQQALDFVTDATIRE